MKRLSNDKKRLKPYITTITGISITFSGVILYGRKYKNKHGSWLYMYPLQQVQRWVKPLRETSRMLYLKHRRPKKIWN